MNECRKKMMANLSELQYAGSTGNKFYSDLPQVLVLNQITLCFYELIHTTDLCGDSLVFCRNHSLSCSD